MISLGGIKKKEYPKELLKAPVAQLFLEDFNKKIYGKWIGVGPGFSAAISLQSAYKKKAMKMNPKTKKALECHKDFSREFLREVLTMLRQNS